MSAKRALVCALMPEHDRDSGSRRVLQLVEFLQETGWAVTFVSHHANPDVRYVKALQRRGVAVYSGSKQWVDELIATQGYALAILALWDIAEPYVSRIRRRSPATRIIVDSIDLHLLRDARRTFSARGENGARVALDSNYASAMIRELNTYAAADGVLAVSRKEADLINDFLAEPALADVVPLGEELVSPPMPLKERRGIVFVGCYRFSPNVKAIEYLCQDIVPRLDTKLLARHPVYIVGDGLDTDMCTLANGLRHVHMVGWVPSIDPYFGRSRISVVPLLYGAGTKGKLLQALRHGTPTVSTTVGVEGLNLQAGEQVLIADDAATFADAITELLTDDERWRRLQRKGRDHVAAEYGRELARTSLVRVIGNVLAKDAKPALSTEPEQEQVVRPNQGEYVQLVRRIRDLADSSLPPDAGVIVVSKGDRELLELGRTRRAWHFPQAANGEYAGHYPATSEDAIALLDKLQDQGAEYVLFPATASWWLEHYGGLKQHLAERYQLIVEKADTCAIYARVNHDGDRRPALDAVVLSDELADASEAAEGATRLIAFLLPQFHPIPENDAWWGKGFTEWTNVVAARPQFPDHYQPRLPADLGFYDLRLPEVRQAQAALAKAYGIHGFCYYHYWFNGKLLLERPFDEVLRSGQPDFPFCLCWANEPWSRRWDGRPRDILQVQSYSLEDDAAHIRWLLPALADQRAIRIDGKPVFIVYQGKELPDPGRTIDIWREEVLKAGLSGLYLIACETGWDAGWDATSVGFDAKVLFTPQFSILFGSGTQIPVGPKESLRVFDYQRAWPILAKPPAVSHRQYETVCPSWDNSARAGDRAVILHNSTPEAYERWLKEAIGRVNRQPADHRIVFINAWNEWAEGCHLEPDKRYGRAYLEATKRALMISRPVASESTSNSAAEERRTDHVTVPVRVRRDRTASKRAPREVRL